MSERTCIAVVRPRSASGVTHHQVWRVLLFASLLLLAACAAKGPFRSSALGESERAAFVALDCDADPRGRAKAPDWYPLPRRSPPEPDAARVHLGVVEFDEQGELFDKPAFARLMDEAGAIARNDGALVLLFIHGWNHNAQPCDSNLIAFEQALQQIAKLDAELCAASPACAQRKVIGIYAGWRGLSLSAPVLKRLTFWSRKNAAHRMGQQGIVRLVSELSKIRASRSSNRLALVGHSFGGAALYSATHHLFVSDIIQQRPRDGGAPTRSRPRRVADLAVLINPAFEALRLQPLVDVGESEQWHPRQRPMLAVFTSVGDRATGTAFPIGRSVATLLQSHTYPAQRRMDVTAVGHYEGQLTHTLDAAPARAAGRRIRNDVADWRAYQDDLQTPWSPGWATLARHEPGQCAGHDARSPGRNCSSPIMVVRVERDLIPDHNAIWGEDFAKFLYHFVAVQVARE
jgi:hypothetical protein